jgi:predicted Zn-dependent protease
LGQFMLGAAYGRDAEREADALAIRLMKGAGLDGARLASFLQRVSKAEDAGAGIPAFLSTHPAPAERVDWILGHAGKGNAPFDDAHWSAIKAICS